MGEKSGAVTYGDMHKMREIYNPFDLKGKSLTNRAEKKKL